MRTATRSPTDPEKEIDLRAIARVGLLIGANFTLTGILAQHPVFRSMAKAYALQPPLTPGQTIFLGLAVLAGSAAVHVWHRTARPAHRR